MLAFGWKTATDIADMYFSSSFITFQDVKDLFGSGNQSDDMFQMWQEGMTEYACPLGRITYDDFRMILKGRGRELEQPALIKRSTLLPKVKEGSPLLQAVPEGSMSPQVKHAIFTKFDDTPPSLKMPSLDSHPEDDNLKPSLDTKFPLDLLPALPTHRRIRSGSLGSEPRRSLPESPLGDLSQLAELTEDEEDEDLGSAEMSIGLHSLDAPASPTRDYLGDFPSERTNGGETFKQHNDFRRSILKASRTFEAKVLARKLEIAAAANQVSQPPVVDSRASLIMRRGTQAQRPEIVQIDNRERSDSPASSVASDKQATATEVAAACKRGGRPRRERRKRTTSDISGMLK